MEKDTTNLMGILKGSGKDDIERLSKEHFEGPQLGFVTYIKDLIAEKQLKHKDIFQKADVPVKYGYQLLNKERNTKQRDYLLRIFISMGMTLKETQRALEIYGLPALYPKNKRDAVIIIAINNGMSAVDEVSELLIEHGEEKLKEIDVH